MTKTLKRNPKPLTVAIAVDIINTISRVGPKATTKDRRAASINSLRAAFAYFAKHPDGRVPTGIWHDAYWGQEWFLRWFRSCLDAKINRDDARKDWRKFKEDYQIQLRSDAWRINEYAQGVRHSGCRSLLRLDEYRALYPHINNQPREL